MKNLQKRTKLRLENGMRRLNLGHLSAEAVANDETIEFYQISKSNANVEQHFLTSHFSFIA